MPPRGDVEGGKGRTNHIFVEENRIFSKIIIFPHWKPELFFKVIDYWLYILGEGIGFWMLRKRYPPSPPPGTHVWYLMIIWGPFTRQDMSIKFPI